MNLPFEQNINAYHYDLPEKLIASRPNKRGLSRLMLLNNGGLYHHCFSELPDLLPKGALLIANNSRVFPARIIGNLPTGGKLECLLLSPLPLLDIHPDIHTDGQNFWARARGLLKPAKRILTGKTYDFSGNLKVTALEKGSFGQFNLCLNWKGNLQELFEKHGLTPLPPYMRREAEEDDKKRYQTIYARKDKCGSVAAPTAGLHFTPDMKKKLEEKGFLWAEITLHVGYGTFSPVRDKDISKHKMHREYVEIPEKTARLINEAKASGRKIIAIGTTSTRALEGVAAGHKGKIVPYSGWIDIFIRPAFEFKVIDGLLSNFHLPESTLLMLVSAFAGRERVLAAYAEAVRTEYAFFSYGDAMLML